MTRCPRCKNDTVESRVIRYSQEYEDKVYIIENVPAFVCRQCGEIFLSEEIAEKIQDLIWSGAEPQRVEEVPVYRVA